MKAKVNRGKSFNGLLKYLFEEEKDSKIVAGNMLGENCLELSDEFACVRKLKNSVEKPVWHCSLSLPKDEKCEDWDKICSTFMKKMGFSDLNSWVAIKHHDTDYEHVHIIASRIGLDGSLWFGEWEAMKAITATQAIEKDYNLNKTKGFEKKSDKKKLTDNEINMGIRTLEEPKRQFIQDSIDLILKNKKNIDVISFIKEMEKINIKVKPNIASTNKMNGFSFEVDTIAFKGSSLGKSYTWENLKKRGVEYVETRDGEELKYYRSHGTFERTNRETSHTESKLIQFYENDESNADRTNKNDSNLGRTNKDDRDTSEDGSNQRDDSNFEGNSKYEQATNTSERKTNADASINISRTTGENFERDDLSVPFNEDKSNQSNATYKNGSPGRTEESS